MSTQQKIKRKPLAVKNEYYTGPSKNCRFRISELWFRGPNPGVAVQWLTVGGQIDRGQFYLCRVGDEFWNIPTFQNAIDAEAL
jgi:hypothetical protein